ncbi:hypothetical protein PISMIDRAFT_681515 [Pisolithus microcarpus 441]|uniref:Uncharacterized protein n=1 Tax=Pisolithus microcarpus 441 TaxID=765257 RepID=A0A0C9ZFP7_9AGAM|nr:hypothetical protein PISMIDRAFT_681515 [Pisolithus microcarpus 441]
MAELDCGSLQIEPSYRGPSTPSLPQINPLTVAYSHRAPLTQECACKFHMSSRGIKDFT